MCFQRDALDMALEIEYWYEFVDRLLRFKMNKLVRLCLMFRR